jgi:CHASE3 domain sensor protein
MATFPPPRREAGLLNHENEKLFRRAIKCSEKHYITPFIATATPVVVVVVVVVMAHDMRN